ncbi:Uma2 family endonuclease [Scytonema hofmannii]|uniref:Uma2 family endonuclease n=1 Tax=Scytonema hofmannii TaxID=34078 RepID=UPI000347E893|nr:Uma2 family endonuclease [Scytonema hofmannii]
MNLFPVPQTDPPLPAWQTLPTMYDLKSEDPEEPGLPDEFHDLQPQVLSRTLRLKNYTTDQFFTGTDLNLYYDVEHTLWHKRPDWFLVIGVPRLYAGHDLRRSYVIWQERRNPFVVVELLSPGTETEDLGIYAESEHEAVESVQIQASQQLPSLESQNGSETKDTPPSKWFVYEQLLRVPYYIVFSRYTNRVRFFKLVGGHYQEQQLDATNPRIWIEELEIGLGLWLGEFAGVTRLWLRWYDAQGNWIPTDTELERQEKQQALEQIELERQEKQQALEQIELERQEKQQALEQIELERQEKQQALEQIELERIRAQQVTEQLLHVARNLLQTGMSIALVSQLTGLPETEVQKLQE